MCSIPNDAQNKKLNNIHCMLFSEKKNKLFCHLHFFTINAAASAHAPTAKWSMESAGFSRLAPSNIDWPSRLYMPTTTPTTPRSITSHFCHIAGKINAAASPAIPRTVCARFSALSKYHAEPKILCAGVGPIRMPKKPKSPTTRSTAPPTRRKPFGLKIFIFSPPFASTPSYGSFLRNVKTPGP